MIAFRWLARHPFVAGVVAALVAVLALPGSWVAQYGIRRSVVEDGAVLAVRYVTPAFTREWSIEAAPYADPAPSPAPVRRAAAGKKGRP